MKVKDLPEACKKYPTVVAKLESKEQAAADPFGGMGAGAAVKARSARSKGGEHHAQIQRRLTAQGRRFSKLDK